MKTQCLDASLNYSGTKYFKTKDKVYGHTECDNFYAMNKISAKKNAVFPASHIYCGYAGSI